MKTRIEDLHPPIQSLEEDEIRHRIFELEKDCLKGLTREGSLSEESLQKLQVEIGRRMHAISDPGFEPNGNAGSDP